MSENIVKPFHVMDILARCKAMEAQGRDIVHMEIGEPDFTTPQPIIDAGIQALQENLTHYTSAQGLYSLREKISQYYLNRFAVKIHPEQIIITPGASGALQLILSYVLATGKKIMLCDPSYPCNKNVAQLLKGEVVSVPVNQQTQYQLNIDLLEKHWQDDVAAVLVASPSNPTGTICSKEQLMAMAEFLAAKNSLLIVDEIYQGLTYEQESQTVAGSLDNVFILNSFSKYFGMTGWRIGWLCSPDRHIQALDAIAQNTYLASSTIAQHAALAAFEEETMVILEQRREIFNKRRDLLCDALNALRLEVPVVPQGAFYIYAKVTRFSQDSFSFCQALLEDQGVAITPGCDFGDYQANDYVRFAYTTSEARINEGMQRLENFLAR